LEARSARSPSFSIANACWREALRPKRAVNEQSLLLPAGNVKIGDFDYNVYTNSLIQVVDRMNEIPIKVQHGVPIRLGDVGKAVDSTMIQGNVVRVNSKRAVYLPILKQAGANTIAVMDGVKEGLPKLIGLPADFTVKLLFDQSLYVRITLTPVTSIR
jgi:multidrug efflux pump subunit AcrB